MSIYLNIAFYMASSFTAITHPNLTLLSLSISQSLMKSFTSQRITTLATSSRLQCEGPCEASITKKLASQSFLDLNVRISLAKHYKIMSLHCRTLYILENACSQLITLVTVIVHSKLILKCPQRHIIMIEMLVMNIIRSGILKPFEINPLRFNLVILILAYTLKLPRDIWII